MSLVVLIVLGGCDFPSDPPLKTTVTPPPVISVIDTAKTLLPLAKGITWIYVGVANNQQSEPYQTSPLEIKSMRTYFRLSYSVNVNQGGPPRIVTAFPNILRNLPEGLAFYETNGVADTSGQHDPNPAFVLPYPSVPGAKWSSAATSDFTVRVVSKDTLITGYTEEKRAVYRYEVTEKGKSPMNFYVLPGKALLRIERADATFYTVAWLGI
jgi:hypothetical protein